MKHFNIKAIALVILLAIEVIVGTKLVFCHSAPKTDIVPYVTSILAKNKIRISPELISTKDTTVYDCTMQYVIDDKAAFAKRILGNNATKAGNSDNLYSAGSDQLTFNGAKFTYTPQNPVKRSEFYNLDSSNAGAKAKDIFNEYGFNIDGSIISISKDGDKISAGITKTINTLPVFNNEMHIEMSRNGISLINGVWYTVSSELSNPRTAKSATDALLDFMKSNQHIRSEIKIDVLTLGYLLTSPDKQKSSTKPVWKIVLSDGTIFYVDA